MLEITICSAYVYEINKSFRHLCSETSLNSSPRRINNFFPDMLIFMTALNSFTPSLKGNLKGIQIKTNPILSNISSYSDLDRPAPFIHTIRIKSSLY